MKLTVRRVLGFGGALAALVVVLLAWWLWPAGPAEVEKVAEVAPAAPKPKVKVAADDARVLEPRKEGDILDQLGIDPEITPNCALINQWHHRNVPMWVILDNMEAQGMMFHEFELECLTTSPVPPGILTWAENHIDHNTNALLAEGGQ